ncbi:nuclear transport factor 2 family protein [Streptomyces sp.]|uniref:nuclear transport factor 2 family protein n=1 Tax=Streptomyces sp. TaxID=1931 RepID=UPI002F3EFE5B
MAEPVPYNLYIRFQELSSGWDAIPGWVGGTAVVAGYQSAELCLRLIDDALRDQRPAAFAERRIDGFTDLLSGNLMVLGEFLATQDSPPAHAYSRSAAGAPPSGHSGYEVLFRLGPDRVRGVAWSFFEAHRGVAFRTGVEETVAAACRRLDIPVPPRSVDKPRLDYAAVVGPAAVWGLRSDDPQGPEDHIFCTAHQITECWLHIANHCLESGTAAAGEGDWGQGARMLRMAVRAVSRASAAGQILELMDLSDYHPLRVRLRDGSGAQSQAVRELLMRIHESAAPLLKALEDQGVTLLRLLSRTGGTLPMHEYLRALKAVSKSFQAFLFHHYLLVLDVLGSHMTGSLGYEVTQMIDRASQPPVPQLNQAHYDFAKYTNLRYAPLAGSLVLANERAAGWNPPPAAGEEDGPCPPETMARRVRDYFRCLEERDADGWAGLFEPETGRLYDMPGTRPFIGGARLGIFVRSMFTTFAEMRASIRSTTFDGNRATVEWTICSVAYQGGEVEFSGREEFVFSTTGRIAQAVVHWDPEAVAHRLWPELTA